MGYYTLKNPRAGIHKASINVFYIEGHGEKASINVTWRGMNPKDLGYSFNGLVAAKRYFGKHYQSKKDGFETPIWEKQIIQPSPQK